MVRGDSLAMVMAAAERLRATQPQYRPKQAGDSAPPLPYPKQVLFYGDSGYVTFALSQTRWVHYGLDKKDAVWVVRERASVVEAPAADTAAVMVFPPPPPRRPKPDTLTLKVFRSGPHFTNPATIRKDAVLQVDTLKGAPRGDGTCNFDAGTPIRKPGTLRAATQVDGCSIIYWTVDSAKLVDATKRAKPDTKP